MTLQSSSQHFSFYTFFRITHTIFICSIYCFLFYCVLCIILQCSNILQLQYVFLLLVTHITISATILLLLLLLVWFLIIGNYTARGERLKTVALILMRVLLLLSDLIAVSISNVINCLPVYYFVSACECECSCDDCLGSWVRLLEFATIIILCLCLVFACFDVTIRL